MKTVMVTGGRNYIDAQRVYDELERENPDGVLQGGATGADAHARSWARTHGKGLVTVEADWKTYGKSAGPRRNQMLVDMRPDVVLAFPGGRGTADAVRRAKAAGLVVREICPAS